MANKLFGPNFKKFAKEVSSVRPGPHGFRIPCPRLFAKCTGSQKRCKLEEGVDFVSGGPPGSKMRQKSRENDAIREELLPETNVLPPRPRATFLATAICAALRNRRELQWPVRPVELPRNGGFAGNPRAAEGGGTRSGARPNCSEETPFDGSRRRGCFPYPFFDWSIPPRRKSAGPTESGILRKKRSANLGQNHFRRPGGLPLLRQLPLT